MALFSMSQAVSDGVPVKEMQSWSSSSPMDGDHLSRSALPSDLGQLHPQEHPVTSGNRQWSTVRVPTPKFLTVLLWNAGHSGLARPGLRV